MTADFEAGGWCARTAAETAQLLAVDTERGLDQPQVTERRAKIGANLLKLAKPKSAFLILLHQFSSLMVGLLVVAGIVAFATGDRIEALAILVVIFLNAVIGFFTEWKAISAIEGLRKQTIATARVKRAGAELQLAAPELVPGDIVLLAAGDRVPADARIVEHASLRVDESALTGESLPVEKTDEAVLDSQAPVAEQTCMVHMGTAVTAGRATVIVTTTGSRSAIGQVGKLIDDIDERATPLEAKLAQLGRVLLGLVLLLSVIIVVVGWLRGNPLRHMVEVGVSLAIAAVPEGLLAVTTMTLAVGMQRMAQMNALVRRLPAVEALGSTTVICSDKTGTLTRNEMTVRAFEIAESHVTVDGTGYAPTGEFKLDEKVLALAPHADDAAQRSPIIDALQMALRIGALCNDAKIERSGAAIHVLGDPTEAALRVAAEKSGLVLAELENAYPRIAEVPFHSETKRMVTVHTTQTSSIVAYAKGSPAAILEACTSIMRNGEIVSLTDEARAQTNASNEKLAASALRVLGLAYRELPPSYTESDLTRELTFVALVGMIDPLRDEAKETIALCRKAGIRTVMITGDQQRTAAEIARQLGLDQDSVGKPLRTIHARELKDLDADGWLAIVADAAVFARTSPEDKLKIVDAFQRHGEVVAMTGDGVNDAPALHKADIGIAMGIRGTEVAKEAAAMVITDDNFATIVRAVEQGRIIVSNLTRFIHYLFSSNLAEVVTVFGAIILGWPLPLGVLQILWLNLVTDTFPAMALALEPSAPDVMSVPPRNPKEPLITARFGWLIGWQGSLLAVCTLGAFAVGLRWYGKQGEGLDHAVTMAFMTLALAQILHAYNARSQTRSIFTSGVLSNPWLLGSSLLCIAMQLASIYLPFLRNTLHTVLLSVADWAVVCAGALAPVVVVEVIKAVQRGIRSAHHAAK